MGDFERELRKIIEVRKKGDEEKFRSALRDIKDLEERERSEQQTREQVLLRRLAKEKEILQRIKKPVDSGMEAIGKATWGKGRFSTSFRDYTDVSCMTDFEIATWEIGASTKEMFTQTTGSYTLWLCRGKREDETPYLCPLYTGEKESHFPVDEGGLRESLRLLAEAGPHNRSTKSGGVGRWGGS